MSKHNLKAEEVLQGQIRSGERWARILMLKRSHEYADRYQTTWGDKTALGIYLVMCRLVGEVEDIEGGTK